MHDTLQHTATLCNRLQHAATHCNKGMFIDARHVCYRTQYGFREAFATRCATLQQISATLQQITSLCTTQQYAATNCNTLQHMQAHRRRTYMPFHIFCCSLLQCVFRKIILRWHIHRVPIHMHVLQWMYMHVLQCCNTTRAVETVAFFPPEKFFKKCGKRL